MHLRSHEDVLSWLARNRGRANAIVTVNAPVIVENGSGQRPCDQQIADHFSRYQIDDYQVNIVSAGHPRTMARAMMRMGFDADPESEGDRVVETYTLPAQILLFDLERPIRMKHGAIGTRKDAVSRFRDLVVSHLLDAVPSLAENDTLGELLDVDLGTLNGTRLGELEESLEAMFCAYIGAYLDIRGPDDCAFLGDLQHGYVLLPTSSQPREPVE
jgi:predicted RNase H-like nuclease